MGKSQAEFLSTFKEAFKERFGTALDWRGGQSAGNVARLPGVTSLRRGGVLRQGERFELGDLRADFGGRTIVVEYDQTVVSLSNLVKYWPYARGELSVRPACPLMLCHFSKWWSYGSHRDLWDWMMARMCSDRGNIIEIAGRQFDHGGADENLRARGIRDALEWVADACAGGVNAAPSGD